MHEGRPPYGAFYSKVVCLMLGSRSWQKPSTAQGSREKCYWWYAWKKRACDPHPWCGGTPGYHDGEKLWEVCGNSSRDLCSCHDWPIIKASWADTCRCRIGCNSPTRATSFEAKAGSLIFTWNHPATSHQIIRLHKQRLSFQRDREVYPHKVKSPQTLFIR